MSWAVRHRRLVIAVYVVAWALVTALLQVLDSQGIV